MSLRVLLFTSTARNRAGGVQTVYRQLVLGLRSRGHLVKPLWSEGSPDPEHGEAVVRLALPQHRSSSLGTARSAAAALRSAFGLAVEIGRFRPDVVNVHFARPELAFFLLLRSVFRYDLVVSVHGSDLLRPPGEDLAHLGRLLTRCDAVTAVSDELAQRVMAVSSLDRSAVLVVPNGIDTAFWAPQPCARPPGPPTVVSVGRLTPDHKGQDVLLRAFAIVREQCPSAELVLVGEGQWRGELEALSHRLGLDGAVRFTGSLPPDDVRRLLSTVDVFTLASRREGLPMALLEATSCGLPAVVTDVGSMAEVVVEGAGRVVPVDDERALASALVELLQDRQAARQAGARARLRAADFAASTVDAAYEDLFERLREGRAHRRMSRGRTSADEGAP